MKVSNPLTIIAIFAGLAEALATAALVELPLELQKLFVYFVMAFPSGIVLLFFFVLYNKNTVLYAPSDFEDQTHYLEANKLKQTVSDQIDKVFNEINKDGERLSKDEIELAKYSIEKSIEESALSSRAEKILNLLQKGPSRTTEISESLGIHPTHVSSTLNSLEKKGFVTRERTGPKHSKSFVWSINS